jgi:uncharacterized protein YqeY
MPTLANQIDADIKQAMLKKEAEKLSVLRMLKSAVKYAAIEKGGADAELDDTAVIAVVRKEVKKRQDSVESYEKAQRADLADKEKKEIVILNAFLPQAMSDVEVEKIVKDAIAETGATTKAQMGAVMKIAQAKAAGRVDGKTLSQIVGKLLK